MNTQDRLARFLQDVRDSDRTEIWIRLGDPILSPGDHRTDTCRDAACTYRWPSSAVMVSRFGTWRAALKQAGIPLPASTKPPRRRDLTYTDLRDWLTRCFTQAPSRSRTRMAT